MKIVIGIDLGGTEIKFGKFNQNLDLLSKLSIKTNTTNNGISIINDIIHTIKKIIENDELLGIGIGVPGPVDNDIVLGAQNLGWKETNLKKILEEEFNGVKCKILNDANSACLGEMVKGSAMEFGTFIFVTLGTGIGGGIVINHKLISGNNGSAGEIGHLKVESGDKRLCTCGLYDCVEQYSSATGILKTAKEMIKKDSMLYNFDNLTCKDVFDCAKANDKISLDVINDATKHLAIALSYVADILNPEAFIIGGGVSKAGSFLLERIENNFSKLAFPHVRNVKFKLATLGNDAGIYGSAYFALEEIK